MQRDPAVPYFHPRLRIGRRRGRQGIQEARLEVLNRLEARAELRVDSRPGNGRGFADWWHAKPARRRYPDSSRVPELADRSFQHGTG